MLGHKLCQVFSKKFETFATTKGNPENLRVYNIFDESKLIGNIDVHNFERVHRVFKQVVPDVVMNCIGIVKQAKEAKDAAITIELNSLFPHKLFKLCKDFHARLIHMSTDCVFSGRKGNYTEKDFPDVDDLYGRSKLLGEVIHKRALTIRSSIIGRELSTSNGLLEWFFSMNGKKIKGYKNAIFSGFTTLELGNVLTDIIENHPDLSGLFHVSSKPISKCELLKGLRDKLNLDIEIEIEESFHCNRSLNCSLFSKVTGFVPTSWDNMMKNFVGDYQQYLKWRK